MNLKSGESSGADGGVTSAWFDTGQSSAIYVMEYLKPKRSNKYDICWKQTWRAIRKRAKRKELYIFPRINLVLSKCSCLWVYTHEDNHSPSLTIFMTWSGMSRLSRIQIDSYSLIQGLFVTYSCKSTSCCAKRMIQNRIIWCDFNYGLCRTTYGRYTFRMDFAE